MEDTGFMEDMVILLELAYIIVNTYHQLDNMDMDILNLFQSKDLTEIMFQNIESNIDLLIKDMLITKKYIFSILLKGQA